MAVRDDSVIRGGLITCVIFLLLSLVGNYFMYQSSDKASTELAQSKEELNQARADVRARGTENLLMKAMLGIGEVTEDEFNGMKDSVGADQDMNQIQKQYVDDMTLMTGPGKKNYHALPAFMMQTIREKTAVIENLTAQVDQLQKEKNAIIDQETKRADAAVKAKVEVEKQLEAKEAELVDARNTHLVAQAKMQDLVTQANQKITSITRAASKNQQMLKQESAKLQTTIDHQVDVINGFRNEKFETSQGRVVHVVPGGNMVFINLGSADGLSTGVTFGVLDQDEVDVIDAKPKANLEVIKITDSHLATARVIFNDDIRNPVIEDDKIFTPFWAPGRKVEIALAGKMDYDGDGNDDSDRIKSMIRSVGASVSAQVDEQGVMTGKLTFDTRFLVLSADVDDANPAVGKLKSEAKQLGITSISLTKLLGYLRSLDENLVVPLGTGAKADDFQPTAPPGIAKRRPSTISSLYDRDPPQRDLQKGK